MDSDSARIEKGTLAAVARQELYRRVNERSEALLTNAISKARTKDGLSGDEAKAVIAAIGEMRLLLGDVERDIRQGEEARNRIVSPSRN